MSNILTVQEFREIFNDNNTIHFTYKDFEKLYEELKELNSTQLSNCIRAFNAAAYVYKERISKDKQQFNDKFEADTKDLIQAHNTNMLFVKFSPLLEELFLHYIYIHYFTDNKKLEKLKDEIELLFKEQYPPSSYKYSDRKIIRFEKLIRMKKFRNLSDLRLNENKLNRIKRGMERNYKRKYHQDDHYKWLIYELDRYNILDEIKANKILKSFFGYKGNYIQCDDNLKSQFKYNTAAFVISRNF